MGHLSPGLSLASALSSAPYHCHVTLVVVVPLITAAESDQISTFFSSHPHIHRIDFHLELDTPAPGADPFFPRYDAVSRSAHHMAHRLTNLSPPVSATFSDFMFTKGFNTTLPPHLPNYTVSTTSARFFSLLAHLPHLLKSPPPSGRHVEIPGLGPFQTENIPPPFFNPDHVFTSMLASNAQYYSLSKGVLVNTFHAFEPETLSALESSTLLPPIFPIGPLYTLEAKTEMRTHEERDELVCWLDEQTEESVIYVSFGNRTAMSGDQVRELGMGLERSGCRFVWVVKTSKVDKEEKEDEELREILGQELHEKLCKKGKMVKKWVNQKEVLGHKAVGGFVSHCGWNSVMEAAVNGVPVVAWPQHGDQRENAAVVEKAGLGVWERGWGMVVGAEEIAEKVELVMGKEGLRKSARRVGVEAERVWEVGGSSRVALMSIIQSLKH